MTKYAYVSCLGNVYVSSDPDCDNEPCEMCGDYDRCIGTVNNNIDLARIMLEDGFAEDYILEKTGYEIEYKKVKDVEWEDE